MLTLVRIFFCIIISSVAALLVVGTNPIQIETSLNDLNPDRTSNQGAALAIDKLLTDINQRFVVLIKGKDEKAVDLAVTQLKNSFDKASSLHVLYPDAIAEEFLTLLEPYKFNLLTKDQRCAIREGDVTVIAKTAQRRLYQPGDGIRLVPFEEDPLGWFSDYLIEKLERSGLLREEVNGESDLVDQDNEDGLDYFASFSVLISDYPNSMSGQEHLYRRINGTAADIHSEYDVDVIYSGLFFFTVDSAQSAKHDTQLIAVGSTIGILVLMLSVFRSLLPLTLSLGSIAIGIGFGILTSTLIFGSIHIFTVIFGASLIGIVVDYSLHYFYHFLSPEKVPGSNGIDAKKTSRTHPNALYRAMSMSLVTSIVGYGALALSDLLLLKKIALFSCSGLIMAWLSVIALGPLVTNRPIVARQAVFHKVIIGLKYVFGRQPKPFLILGLTISIVACAFLVIKDIDVNDDPRRFFDVSSVLLAQEQEVATRTQVFEPGRYFIVEGDSEAQVYTALEALYSELGTELAEETQQVSSVLDWVPSKSHQRQNRDLQSILYRDDGAVDLFYQQIGLDVSALEGVKLNYANAKDQYLTYASLTEDFPALPPLWFEHDDRFYSIALIRKDSDLESLKEIADGIENIRYINTLGDAIEALRDQRVNGTKFLVVSYVLIAILLIAYYRQLSAVSLLLIPSAASIITIAILVALGQSITIFHIMSLFLVLGLGMDYIIFAKEMTDKPDITCQAILLSAITTLLSFGLLALSSMPIVNAFGSTILIANSINFIAVIALFQKSSSSKETYSCQKIDGY